MDIEQLLDELLMLVWELQGQVRVRGDLKTAAAQNTLRELTELADKLREVAEIG